MKFYNYFILATLVLFGQGIFAQDDDNKKSFGLSASIQDNQLGIMVPFWISKNVSIAPAFGISTAEKVGIDLSIGIIPKFYFKTTKLAPYVSVKFGAIINWPSEENDTDIEQKIDKLAGIGIGAEYFFDKHFSIGVEAQGNVTVSDMNSFRFGNPDGTDFNTATMVTANVYF